MRRYTVGILLIAAFTVASCASAPEPTPEPEPVPEPQPSAQTTAEPEEAVEEMPEEEIVEDEVVVDEPDVVEEIEEEEDDTRERIVALFRRLDEYDNVDVTITVDGVAIAISRAFAPNSVEIDAQLAEQLDLVGQALVQINLEAIVIEGHVAEAGNPASSGPISEGRAESAASYLFDNFDISRGLVTVVGRGGTDPIGDNATPTGRARNRRVVLLITGSIS